MSININGDFFHAIPDKISPHCSIRGYLLEPPGTCQAASDIFCSLKKRVIGQHHQVKATAWQTALFVGKANSKRPMVACFWGPPGCGKTECAKVLADAINEATELDYRTLAVDCNNFSEAHTVYKLFGAPAGYVGYDEPALFECIAEHPRYIIILDEIEKAHPNILRSLMAVFDEGRSTSRKQLGSGAWDIDFRQCIFILTSNANLSSGTSKRIGFSVPSKIEDIRYGEDKVSVKYRDRAMATDDSDLSLQQYLYKETESARKAFAKIVAPEIASRVGFFLHFDPLSSEAKRQVLAKMVIDAALEYDVRLKEISAGILAELFEEVSKSESLTVRSYRVVIDGFFAATFNDAVGDTEAFYLLEGTLEAPRLTEIDED